MFGIRFIKAQPTDYVLLYRNGRLVKEGAGLAFFYFAPTASIVRIPFASMDVPFIFTEITADFQEVTVQGQLTFHVANPKKLSQLMNFTLTTNGHDFTSDDPQKLPQRLINLVQVLTRPLLKTLPLRSVLNVADELERNLRQSLQQNEEIQALGIGIIGVTILAIKPTPETARALEAETRERILGAADEAVYVRRNAAVEQERNIRENELNTEIAVENKKRQIRETQMEAEKSVQQKKRELAEAEILTKIMLEQENRELVALACENAKQEADSRAYGIATLLNGFAATDPKTLQVLANAGMQPGQLIAQAFVALADNADKIGQLNVSPDLLSELLGRPDN